MAGATPGGADAADDASATDSEGVTIDEGELVCVQGAPVTCYYVGTTTSVDTDGYKVASDSGVSTWDDSGAFAGGGVDVVVDADDVTVDGRVCYRAVEPYGCFG